MLIPVVISAMGFFYFKKELKWFEILLNIVLNIALLIGFYYICKLNVTSDVEYNTYLLNQARYYEPYETWVSQTCTRQVACGTDSKGQTQYCTETYDCSYCNRVSERYVLIDSGENEFNISKNEYENFKRLWDHHEPKFQELNRNIDYSGGCGKDGDMYYVDWNGEIGNSITSTLPHSYENILKTNKSAFNYNQLDNTKDLYEYSDINNFRQKSVLGLDSLNFKNKSWFQRRMNYSNGFYGKKYSCKVWVLLFKDKPIEIAQRQEAYWEGGNRNEVVICIGVDSKGQIDWVQPFSWAENKTMIPNLRENILELKTLENADKIVDIIEKDTHKYFKWRDFKKDFSYLDFELSTTQLWIIIFLSIIVSIGVTFWSIKNKI